MSSPSDPPAVNPLPPVVVALALVLLAIELIFQAGEAGYVGGPGAIGWRLEAINQFGFIAQHFDYYLARGEAPLSELRRLVTYLFVHGNFTHLMMVLVFLLALGKLVGEVFGTFGFLAIFFISGIFGALAYWVVLNDNTALIGGFPAVYGLIGAYSFLLWVRLGQTGGPQSRAFALIAMLMAIQLVFGLIFGSNKDWVAELAGFGAGFLMSFVLIPGGWARLLARLRQR